MDRQRGDQDCEQKRREREFVQKQIDEDTCEAHGIFCCSVCFDTTIVDLDPDFPTD